MSKFRKSPQEENNGTNSRESKSGGKQIGGSLPRSRTREQSKANKRKRALSPSRILFSFKWAAMSMSDLKKNYYWRLKKCRIWVNEWLQGAGNGNHTPCTLHYFFFVFQNKANSISEATNARTNKEIQKDRLLKYILRF